MRYAATLLLSLILCPLPLGCGTGGGDAGPEVLFTGPYRVVQLLPSRGWYSTAGTTHTGWGGADADGAGGLSVDLEWSLSSTYFPVDRFNVSADHAFQAGDEYERYDLRGGLGDFGRIAVAGQMGTLRDSSLTIFLSEIGSFDEGSLEGAYHVAGVSQLGTNIGTVALSECRVTFDGYGFLTATECTETAWNVRRTTTPETYLTYSVNEDGGLYMDRFDGLPLLRGAVRYGGTLALAVGSGGSFDRDDLYVLVSASQDLTTASFEGEYWTIGLKSAAGYLQLFTGVLAADGAGGCVFTGTGRRNYDVEEMEPQSWTFDVEPDGGLVLTDPDARRLVGGLTEDRACFAVAGGGWDADQNGEAWFLFGVRR